MFAAWPRNFATLNAFSTVEFNSSARYRLSSRNSALKDSKGISGIFQRKTLQSLASSFAKLQPTKNQSNFIPLLFRVFLPEILEIVFLTEIRASHIPKEYQQFSPREFIALQLHQGIIQLSLGSVVFSSILSVTQSVFLTEILD